MRSTTACRVRAVTALPVPLVFVRCMRIRTFAVALLFTAAPLAAQNTDIEALSGLQFNFGNPGARSLAMGGAFIGLADDASAAEANPAGLTILRKTEASIETRQTVTSQRFPTGGTYPAVTASDFSARQKSVSFASVVLPFERGVAAFYYHRPLSFRNDADVASVFGTPTYYLGPNGPVSREACASTPGCQQRQVYPFRTSADVKIETFGAAFARRWNNVSAGAAIRYHRFQEFANAVRTDLDAPGQPSFLVEQAHAGRLFGNDSEKAVSFVAGVKWDVTSRVSVGGVYKEGPSFAAPVFAGPEGQAAAMVDVTRFHVPATLGIGTAFRPSSSLTLTADAIRVSYSHLTDSFVSVIEYGTGFGVEDVHGYETKNAMEYHAGVEYFILGRAPVAIRAGWWRDPAHTIAYRGPTTTADQVAARILFPGGADESHYSVGLGVAWPRFQVDAGYDTSRTLKTASVSVIARF